MEGCCKNGFCECCSQSEEDLDIVGSLLSKHRKEPIPLKTPIKSGVDAFEYKGFPMLQSKIEMVLLEKPIIHVYEIDWNSNVKDNVVESSEEQDNNEFKNKKARI